MANPAQFIDLPDVKVLFLSQDIATRDAIIFWLENQYKLKIQGSESSTQVIQTFIQAPREFQLIICDSSEAAFKFIDCLAGLQAKIPIIFLEDGKKGISAEALQNINIYKKIDAKKEYKDDLQKTIHQFIEEHGYEKYITQDDDSNFCRISTGILFKVNAPASDIYIKLSDRKYLRIYNKKENFTAEDRANITEKKKLEYLYLKKEDSEKFLKSLEAQLAQMQPKGEGPKAVADYAETAKEVHETIQDIMLKIGPTPEVQNIIKQNVANNLRAIGKQPHLSQFLKQITSEPERYIASHSINLSSVCCAMANAMGWSSDLTYQKLGLAAYLHDFTLKNNDLARMKDLDELEQNKAQFTEEEIKQYRLHPQIGAEILKDFNEIPPDVDIILVQHHEKPDGSGFPRGLASNRIMPLAALFIVAHDFMNFLMDNGKKADVQTFVNDRKDSYSIGNFKRALKAIEAIDKGK